MKRLFLSFAMILGVGCGGDLCDAEVADVSGTWEFTFSDGNDGATVQLDIAEDGTIEVSTEEDGVAIECELVKDEICDLDVDCTTEDGDTFTFSLQKLD